MKTISKFLFFAFLLFFNSAFADLASDAEKLFSWGEQKYPSYFSIGETEVVTKILNYKGHDWYYRYYPETKVFLAINELNKVYVLGGVFGRNLLYIGRLEDLLDVPSLAKPSLTTTPTITQDDIVEIEVNGEDGTTVFVNGVDSGKTIDSTGKVKVVLDTSGDAGDKSFSITLIDDKGNESEALSFTVTKKSTLNEGLVAYYEFEGNANDSSGNGNHGTEHGGLSYTTGVIGKAGSFDGINDYIKIPQSNTLNNLKKEMTISFWTKYYKPTSGSGNVSAHITNGVDQARNKEYGYFNYSTKAGIGFYLGYWGDAQSVYIPIDATQNINKQDFIFVSLVVDSKSLKGYKNGGKVGEKIRKYHKISRPSNNWFIGNMERLYYLNGQIDDLRIYNRALNEAEIKQLYKMGQQ